MRARIASIFTLGVAVAIAPLAGPAGAAAAATPLILTWTQQTPPTSPPVLESATMVYDPSTGTSVLFGGQSNGVDQNQTWIWNGATWTQAAPAHVPPVRYGASMAYDATTGDVVLFGGSETAGAVYLNDTWTWDGSDWTQQLPATSPPADYGTSLAYDAASGTVLLFGGENGVVDNNETWSWNGTTWTQLTPATSPSARYASAMSYDAATGTIVLFGGFDLAASALFGDTWTWDGTTWTQQSPATSPSARDFATMDYDGPNHFTVLFGGGGASGNLADTWTWDGTNWTEYSSATAPPARVVAVSAYDTARSDFVVFGGFGSADLADTWIARFAAAPVVPAPPVASKPALATTGISADGALGMAAVLLLGGAIALAAARGRARKARVSAGG